MTALEALINRLPVVYEMVALPIVCVVAIWLATRLRRDKNGKLYLYSKTYQMNKETARANVTALEDVKQILIQHKEQTSKALTDLTLENLKQTVYLESLNTPTGVVERLIAGLKYIKSGGNSNTAEYVKSLIAAYPIQYETICAAHPELKLEAKP